MARHNSPLPDASSNLCFLFLDKSMGEGRAKCLSFEVLSTIGWPPEGWGLLLCGCVLPPTLWRVKRHFALC